MNWPLPALLAAVAVLCVLVDMAQHRSVTLSLLGVLLVALAVLVLVLG